MVILIPLILYATWKIYEFCYYKSKKFHLLKIRIQAYVTNCNDLNQHIEKLKQVHIGVDRLDYGRSTYYDNSRWNYRRPQLKNQKYAPNIHSCSRSVCDNARKQPFKYICKYFGITANESTLEMFEEVLNNFEAAEQGKKFYVKKELGSLKV